MLRGTCIFVACALALLLAACASDGSFVNPFEQSEPSTTGASYYFSEFSDVPIPNDMEEKRGETYISFAPSGVKCGTQTFKGRMEVVSLMNSMRRNMASNGWTLRSLLRSSESVLVFDKSDRVCSLQISDGLIYTTMQVFMSPRLEGDSGSADVSAYSHPAAQAGRASGAGAPPSGQQPLSQ